MSTTDPNNPSLQPLAPQAPGNVLYGRFGGLGNHMTQNWKTYALVAVVVLVAWWAWKKYA
jgi:hypothetical protein